MFENAGSECRFAKAPEATRRISPTKAVILTDVFLKLDGLSTAEGEARIALDLQGTPFQQKVWKALQKVPKGETISYSDLARRAGVPKAVRATASACARNPVALLVPCHRIVRRDGGLGGYGGGLERKRRLLEIEGACR